MDRRSLIGLPKARRVSGGGGAKAGGYLRLATVTGSTPLSAGRRSVVTVEVGLDVHEPELFARAQQSQPRLNAAFSIAVQREAAQIRPGFPPDVERMAAALQAATDQTLGRRGARLLIGTVMVV